MLPKLQRTSPSAVDPHGMQQRGWVLCGTLLSSQPWGAETRPSNWAGLRNRTFGATHLPIDGACSCGEVVRISVNLDRRSWRF